MAAHLGQLLQRHHGVILRRWNGISVRQDVDGSGDAGGRRRAKGELLVQTLVIRAVAELLKAFTLRGHWYLMPLVVILLSVGSLLVVAASSPLIAPFIYTLF